METLKKIVTNQYFPAGAVLTAVLLFWAVGLLGGLSLLNNNQPPLTTLTWMLFVYMAAVLTPLAGAAAAVDLVRRWRRNSTTEASGAAEASGAIEAAPASEPDVPAEEGSAAQPVPVQDQPVQDQPGQQRPIQQTPVQQKPGSKKAA
ncbi:hypothetical protein [Pseudarthrobacter sp. C1]|uniref:hypothetical protein n=1 Tax=Pseudarthrobacter sp. C1 TaxID=3108940 RepID=UPI002B05E47A|nr:hypothetical protein [Pseudarthrobacter sp. C1]MEA3549154.1 hypothetical protein [Pseudarthrobacter sp. C1]